MLSNARERLGNLNVARKEILKPRCCDGIRDAAQLSRACQWFPSEKRRKNETTKQKTKASPDLSALGMKSVRKSDISHSAVRPQLCQWGTDWIKLNPEGLCYPFVARDVQDWAGMASWKPWKAVFHCWLVTRVKALWLEGTSWNLLIKQANLPLRVLPLTVGFLFLFLFFLFSMCVCMCVVYICGRVSCMCVCPWAWMGLCAQDTYVHGGQRLTLPIFFSCVLPYF